MSLVLNGEEQYLTIADAAALTLTKPFTLAWWQKCTDTTDWRGLFSTKSATGSDIFYAYVRKTGETRANDVVCYIADSGGNVITTTYSYADASPTYLALPGADSTWRHVALTVSHLGRLEWWLDGTLCIGSTTNADFTSCDGDIFYVGRRQSASSWNWLGEMAEVAMWGRTLIPQEIAALAAGSPPGEHRTGLQWWLPLLEDKDPDVGSLTTALVGSPSFTPTGHPVTYNNLTYYNGIGGWQVRPTAEDTSPFMLPESPTMAKSVRVCRGQYFPVSFTLRASEAGEITIAEVGASDIEVDPYLVKRWIQNATEFSVAGIQRAGLLPELLVKNPDLVTPEADNTNTLADPFLDAETIQPVTLTAGESQQFWFICHIPDDLATGTYTATYRISRDAETCFDFVITAEVLAFELAASAIAYTIYYLGELDSGTAPYRVTSTQLAAELADIVKHGLTNCSCNQDFQIAFSPGWTQAQRDKIDEVIAARETAGLLKEPFIINRIGIFETIPPGEEEDALVARVAAAKAWLAEEGRDINDVYVMCIDEPTLQEITDEAATLAAVRATGMKTCQAIYGTTIPWALSECGANIDLPLMHGLTAALPYEHVDPEPWQELGSLAGHWGPTYEKPEYLRWRYGLGAYHHGFDVVSAYTYFEKYGDLSTEDMDNASKDVAFAYRTAGAPIGTVQWWGFSDGINDTRFASALVELGGHVPDPTGLDLDDVRESIIDKIILMRKPNLILSG